MEMNHLAHQINQILVGKWNKMLQKIIYKGLFALWFGLMIYYGCCFNIWVISVGIAIVFYFALTWNLPQKQGGN